MMQPPLCATITIGPAMARASRSIASTRAAQLRSSRPIGVTLRTGRRSSCKRAASRVCQCCATWSRRPGTTSIVGASAATGMSGHLAQEALLPALGVGREAVRRQRLLDGVVEDADLADLARFLARGDLAAELARDANQLLDLLHGRHLFRARLVP